MRIFRRALTFVFIMLLIVSCAGNSVETVPDYDPVSNKDTYDGITLVLAATPYVCYDEDSLFGDLARARVAEVEKKYDVKIEYVDSATTTNNLFYYISSGIKPCDAMISDSYSLYEEIKGNLLYPVDNFYTGIDYRDTSKWGGREKLVTYAYDYHLYGLLPMNWPETIWKQVDHFFFVNEDIISRLNQPDPREYVENKEWTHAKFEEILDAYTHQNNSGDTVYALAVEPAHYFSIAIKASGIDYIVKHTDGTYSNAFYEPGVIDKLTWISDTFWKNWEINITRGSDTFSTIAKFVEGNAVMVLTHLYYGLRDIQFNVDNFGILPFPLSDDLVGSKWIGQFEFYNNGISFPSNLVELEAVPTVINAIFEPLAGYETEEDRFDYYNRYVFHDPRDTAVIFEALDNCHYLPYNDNGYLIPNSINNAHGNKSVSQILDENADIMETTINDVYIPLEETCESLWGD